jgi:hypothetical protein
MPLLDHFHPPVSVSNHWESFHATWASQIATALNEDLPPEFLAEELVTVGRVEIDIATFERSRPAPTRNGSSVAVAEPRTWAPPAPAVSVQAVFADSFQVRVFNTSAGPTLVAVIELVSPGNKDRADERLAFAVKSASYLHQGVSLIIVDVVTNRGGNLHNETAQLFSGDPRLTMTDADLYAVAYRPVLRDDKPQIDIWTHPLAVGQPLPTLPLRLTGDLFVPVDLEASYTEACRRRRLA